MRKFLLLLVIIVSTNIAYAQKTDYSTFIEIEKLLKKTEGSLYGFELFVEKQTFGYNSVSITVQEIVDENVNVEKVETIYTNIIWPKSISKLVFWGGLTDDVNYFFVPLEKEYNLKRYRDGKLVDNFSSKEPLKLYCLPEDRENLKKLFQKLLK